MYGSVQLRSLTRIRYLPGPAKHCQSVSDEQEAARKAQMACGQLRARPNSVRCQTNSGDKPSGILSGNMG